MTTAEALVEAAYAELGKVSGGDCACMRCSSVGGVAVGPRWRLPRAMTQALEHVCFTSRSWTPSCWPR
jgi:hypothetical protein